ncbi:MAG: helix-turn-helix domain-containing protein [Candidatus Methanoplasma sp.]|jgi:AraC family transcriptional regulator of adaptative response / DNA-3-methyladenine glycosylase II|nr:helix-turn-helix domain-containing protein [Candidatus Methanoplasma sp.]
MLKNDNSLYAAFKAKDARFDGRFFVGVSSTRIYCRPICKAKRAKIENCLFFPTAAEAEQNGYRPCLMCRPELAPGSSMTDAGTDLVYRAARMIEKNCGNRQSLNELAENLGCTDRHLRRVFAAEYNVSPVQYLQTCRLLLAKNLLTDTDLPVSKVAVAAGFGSLRRFNDLFRTQYDLSPTALRDQGMEPGKHNGNVTLALGYRPPYRWKEVLEFLDGRAIAGVEVVRDNEYMRTVRLLTAELKPVYGWVRVGHGREKHTLTVTVSESLLPVLPQVLARVRHMFDLYCDPDAVYEVLSKMNDIRPGLCVPGTRLPGSFNAFEMAVRAVLGQQVTVKAASILAARITAIYGKPVRTGIDGLTHVFPSPEDLLSLEGPIENHFGVLGVIATRSKTIHELAKAFVRREVNFDLNAQPEEEIKKLMAIKGIGSWTAQYIAMRAMEWPDAFLETDAGIKKALYPHTPMELLEMAEEWRPFRSYATINLWNAV